MADKSLLTGNEAADTLTSYAALLAQVNGGDKVDLLALGADGEEVTATFLLNSGTVLMVESSNSKLPEPDNSDAVDYMKAKIGYYDSTDAASV
jgi:hypothetical protein